jgi:hypothetical protein
MFRATKKRSSDSPFSPWQAKCSRWPSAGSTVGEQIPNTCADVVRERLTDPQRSYLVDAKVKKRPAEEAGQLMKPLRISALLGQLYVQLATHRPPPRTGAVLQTPCTHRHTRAITRRL